MEKTMEEQIKELQEKFGDFKSQLEDDMAINVDKLIEKLFKKEK